MAKVLRTICGEYCERRRKRATFSAYVAEKLYLAARYLAVVFLGRVTPLPAILLTFHAGNTAGGLLATYTLAASAVGGVAMGMLPDRVGRARTLMISIAWFALFTFLSGLAQSYTQLAVFRALEGLGFGGEWAVGSVLIAEWSKNETRGRNLGFVQSSWAIGWLRPTSCSRSSR